MIIAGIVFIGAIIAVAVAVANKNSKPVDTIDIDVTGDDGQGSTMSGSTYDTQPVEEIKALPKPENPSDADEYFWGNATVYRVTNAKESEIVKTEKNALAFLSDRGLSRSGIVQELPRDLFIRPGKRKTI